MPTRDSRESESDDETDNEPDDESNAMLFEDLIDEVMAEIPAVASTSRNFTNRSQSSSEQLNDRAIVLALKENHQKAIELPAPIERKNLPRSKRRKWSLFSSIALLLATFCLAPRLAQTWTATESTAVASSVSALETESPQFLTKPIEQLRPGDRVMAHNPEVTNEERASYQEPDSTWQLLKMEIVGEDGHRVEVRLLRPRQWVERHGAAVGSNVPIDLKELGVRGKAGVLSVLPCPEIKPGNGQVVTGTFRHSSNDLVEILTDGQNDPIICTANHPFWSEDRKEFIKASELKLSENLLTASGELSVVKAVTPNENNNTVYNLEVNTEHVYFVTQTGILVHNNGGCRNTNDDGTDPNKPSSTRTFVDPIMQKSGPTFKSNFASKVRTKLNQLRKKYPHVRKGKEGIADAKAIAEGAVNRGGGRLGPPVGGGESHAFYYEDGPVTWVFRPNGEFWSMRNN